MRIKILVNTIIFLWSVLTWSQTQNVTLSGKILDANLKEPIAYVNVVLKNNNTNDMINDFCDTYIIENKSTNSNISCKMEWKTYKSRQ